jgi:hypothetical protein
VRDGTHKDERSAATCNVCGAPGKFLCSGCDVQRYCSTGCQHSDWPAHKARCREITKKKAEQNKA